MKEKIIKLLDSRDLTNIIIGITLAYKLPPEEFHELMKSRVTNIRGVLGCRYKFKRGNITYLFGADAMIALDSRVKEQLLTPWEDITPENY